VEIVLAITTPTTIGGWALWHSRTGQTVWAVIASILALVVALKPVFDWPKEIDRYSRLHAEHTVQYYTLKQLVEDIEMEKKITPEMEKRFLDARDRHAQLSKDDDVRPNKRVASRCEREVLQEIPADRLWVPKEGEQR
jgi:hypothetical protein